MASQYTSTPTITLERDIFIENTRELLHYCKENKLSFRPHFKSLKSVALAEILCELNVKSFAVSRVNEAQQISSLDAISDLLIAYMCVDSEKIRAFLELRNKAKLSFLVDSPFHIEQIAKVLPENFDSEIGIYISLDCGLHREGITEIAQLDELLATITNFHSLKISGLYCYLGHLYGQETTINDLRTYQSLDNHISPFLCSIKEKIGNIDVKVIGGASPVVNNLHHSNFINEICCGTRLLNDCYAHEKHKVALNKIALRVNTSVVSTRGSMAIIDIGSRGLSRFTIDDSNSPYGRVVEYPEAKIVRANEEYSWIDFSSSRSMPKLGEQLTLYPANAVLTLSNFSQLQIKKHTSSQNIRIESSGAFF